jgi:hypothetical protein
MMIVNRSPERAKRPRREALFRPKPQLIKSSTPADPSRAELSARKPRILSASPTSGQPPHDLEMNSEPSIGPAVLGSQSAGIHLERLNGARAAIFKQQGELQAKLDAIDTEMRAIEAYEAVRNNKSPAALSRPLGAPTRRRLS